MLLFNSKFCEQQRLMKMTDFAILRLKQKPASSLTNYLRLNIILGNDHYTKMMRQWIMLKFT